MRFDRRRDVAPAAASGAGSSFRIACIVSTAAPVNARFPVSIS